MENIKINPIILVGGTGTRLWPLSRANYPKQFAQLDGQYSLFQQTLLRVQKIQNLNHIYLIVNESNYFLCLDQLNELKIEEVDIIVEPVGRNTAPAVACAAHILKLKQQENELMLVLPSDHKIKNAEQFAESINQAATFSSPDKLILFGIKPNEPSTAYGYIQSEHAATTPAKVNIFFEKPDIENAKILMSQPNCYWNSGMFLFSADAVLKEMALHAPDINQLASAAATRSITRSNTYYLHSDDFTQMPNVALDVAVMEKTQAAFVLELQSDWSDLGDWNAIYKNSQSDEHGNVSIGNTFSHNTKNSYLHSNDKLLATVGVDNLIVVASKDSVLIADKRHTQDVKVLVDLLKSNGYADYVANDLKVHRPWGTYESVIKSTRFQVKHIVVKPSGKLSLQSHCHRSEHWIVVKGIAEVVCGEQSFQVCENESTFYSKRHKTPINQPSK